MAKDKSKSKGKKKAKAIERDVEKAIGASTKVPDDGTVNSLADLFKLFADSTRLRILYALVNGERCVADISEAARVSQSTTSHQLHSLKQAGLVEARRNGKQVMYSLANGEIPGLLIQGVATLDQ